MDYFRRHFTIVSRADNNTCTFSIPRYVDTSHATSISYSVDNGVTWVTTNVDSTNQTITVSGLNNGDKVLWKGIARNWAAYYTQDRNSQFNCSKEFAVEGNIMSLLSGDSFYPAVQPEGNEFFCTMFKQKTNLVDAENLMLTIPVPNYDTYRNMFEGCTNLVKGPQIICEGLASTSMAWMFSGCTKLNYVVCTASYGLNLSYVTTDWLQNVALTGTFVKSPNATTGSTQTSTQWGRGGSGIPNNWTVVDYVEPIYFGVVPDTINSDYTGTTETVELTSEGPWTASTNDSWISVSPLSGSTGGSVTITIAANNGNARTGTVTFTDSGSNVIDLTVNQENYPLLLYSCRFNRSGSLINKMYRSGELIYQNVVLSPTLELSNNTITFQKSGGTMNIGVTSNTSWNASTSDSWLTISTAGTGFTVTAANYTGDSDRTGTITVTARNAYSSITKTIEVEQEVVIDYTTRYVTTRSLVDNNTIRFRKGSRVTNARATYVAYSTDNGANWTTMNISSSQQEQTLSVVLNSGETAIWKGEVTSGWTSGSSDSSYYSNFLGSGDFEVEGNLMSMVWGDDFSGKTTMPRSACRDMFRDSTNLVSARNFKLTATSFGGDGNYGYEHMFSGCSKLEQGPDLDAFSTLLPGIYKNFFYNCTSLKYIKCTATNTGANECTVSWVYGVPSGGTFVKAASKSWSTGISGIPSGWTVVNAS